MAQLDESLDQRIADMATQVSRNDLTGVNEADIAFHADLCLISNNRIVWTLWQAIARHVWIVFGRNIFPRKPFPISSRSMKNSASQFSRAMSSDVYVRFKNISSDNE